jgi:hypothetical protein
LLEFSRRLFDHGGGPDPVKGDFWRGLGHGQLLVFLFRVHVIKGEDRRAAAALEGVLLAPFVLYEIAQTAEQERAETSFLLASLLDQLPFKQMHEETLS